MWRVTSVFIIGFCAGALAGDIDAGFIKAREKGRIGGAVLAERRNDGWQCVGLTRTAQTDADVHRIAALSTLESLDLRAQATITEGGWLSLAALRELRHLTIRSSRPPEGLSILTGLVALESLDLYECGKLPDEAFAALKSVPHLRQLRLPGGFGDAALQYITPLQELEELGVSGGYNLTDTGVARLATLRNLRSLAINHLGPKGKAALMTLPHLEAIHIIKSQGTNLDLLDWEGMRSLTLGGRSLGSLSRRLDGIVKLPRGLRELNTWAWTPADVADGMFRLEEPLPTNLEVVRLNLGIVCSVGKRPLADLAWLRALPSLRELALENPTGDEVTAVSGLAGLRSLKLIGDQGSIADEDLKIVASFRQLESLAIGCPLRFKENRSDALSLLSALTGLRRLELGSLGTAELGSMWKLTGLEVLRLGLPTNAPDAAVEEGCAGIASLSKLQELSLRGKVTDATLKHLAVLKKLRRLDLTGSTGYTDEGLTALVNALPELMEVKWSITPAAAKPGEKKGE